MHFLEGEIENIPLPDNSADVVTLNCVINLSADKDRVIKEAFRVLKPGGRFAVSDVVMPGELPTAIRRSVELWVGCVAGALSEQDYLAKLTAAGFQDAALKQRAPTRSRTRARSSQGKIWVSITLRASSTASSPAASSALRNRLLLRRLVRQRRPRRNRHSLAAHRPAAGHDRPRLYRWRRLGSRLTQTEPAHPLPQILAADAKGLSGAADLVVVLEQHFVDELALDFVQVAGQ